MSERSSFFSDVSWFQVVAGALAAMTAAWIASTLGVGGTIIGAALGSLVVTITSSLYAAGLDRGRTLIVQTDSGQRVETQADPGDTVAAIREVEEATGSPARGAEVVEEPARRIRWKVVAVTTAIVLALSGAAMGSYELVSGQSYGASGDNARLGNPFGGDPAPADDDGEQEQAPEDEPTPEPSASAPAPDPEATPSPTATATPPQPTTPRPSVPVPDPAAE